MLDLTTVLDEKYYEIRLLDGTELHLDRPTQAMLENTFVIDKLANSEQTEQTIKGLTLLFLRILNRNKEGTHYEFNDIVEDYSFEIIGYVIEDYFNFWNTDTNNKVDFPES